MTVDRLERGGGSRAGAANTVAAFSASDAAWRITGESWRGSGGTQATASTAFGLD